MEHDLVVQIWVTLHKHQGQDQNIAILQNIAESCVLLGHRDVYLQSGALRDAQNSEVKFGGLSYRNIKYECHFRLLSVLQSLLNSIVQTTTAAYALRDPKTVNMWYEETERMEVLLLYVTLAQHITNTRLVALNFVFRCYNTSQEEEIHDLRYWSTPGHR